MNTDPKFSTHIDPQPETPKTDAGAPTTRKSFKAQGAGPGPGPEYYNIAAGDGSDDDKPDDTMGAAASAVRQRTHDIEKKVKQSKALAGLSRAEPYNLNGVAGSSNDARPGLINPLFAGNGGPKQPPPDGGGARVLASTTPVQADVPMRRIKLTGKREETTGPLETRRRLNKKNHHQHHT